MTYETIVTVLKTYEIHFPHFFRDKTTEDKARLTADWYQIYKDVDDDVFIEACGKAVKEVGYFPSTKEIFERINQIEKVKAFNITQKKFELYNLVEKANWSTDVIERLAFIDSLYESEDTLTEEDFMLDKQKAIETLKNEYGLSNEQILVFGKKLEEIKDVPSKQEWFRNVLYDAIVVKKLGIKA